MTFLSLSFQIAFILPIILSIVSDEIHRNLQNLLPSPNLITSPVEAIRLFHGRGKCFEGWEFLTIDYYPPVILVVLYQPLTEMKLKGLAQVIFDLQTPLATSVVIQHRYQRPFVAEILFGDPPLKHYALEDGFKYQLNPIDNQNIGFFMDMRLARKLVRQTSTAARVLNLFSYTCSFSVSAIAGGAQHVTNVDMKKAALRTGQVNHSQNQLPSSKASFISGDVLKLGKRLTHMGPFDLVIIDPPNFQKGSFNLEKDYSKVFKHLPRWLSDQGRVLASLNTPYLPTSFLHELFKQNLPHFANLQWLDLPNDFPEASKANGLRICLGSL